jgi:hypothetical protein
MVDKGQERLDSNKKENKQATRAAITQLSFGHRAHNLKEG